MKDYFENHLTVEQLTLYQEIVSKDNSVTDSLDMLVDSLICSIVESHKLGYNEGIGFVLEHKIKKEVL